LAGFRDIPDSEMLLNMGTCAKNVRGENKPMRLRHTLFADAYADAAPPPPETVLSRRAIRLVGMAAVAMSIVYLTWRATSTINPENWFLAVPMWIVELHAALGLALFVIALWDIDRRPQHRIVKDTPLRVAILIPTYNEPIDVLLPTVAGALGVQLPHETWILDDGGRPEVRAMAAALGAGYLARPTHEHAKAGNLNYALARIAADIVAVFDADHVPSARFLTQTLGYFDDPRVAVVQTPQDFYNTNSFEHGEKFMEERIFYRVIAPGKNRWGAAFWAGTCALVRTEALRMVEGVATDAITEDILTTIRMQRHGWRTVYHNEVLATGLAPSDATRYLTQRGRWARGAMQVLRNEPILTSPGLTAAQRLAYLTTLLGWFDAWRVLAYVLLPIGVIFTGISPIGSHLEVYLPMFLGTFALHSAAMWMLSRRNFRPWQSLVFAFIQLPAVLPATLAIFGGSFNFEVTGKGRAERRRARVPALLRVLLGITVLSALWFLASTAGLTATHYSNPEVPGAAFLFTVINAALLAGAIGRIRDSRYAGEQRAGYRFDRSLKAAVRGPGPAPATGYPVRAFDISVTGCGAIEDRDRLPEGFRNEVLRLSIESPSGYVTLSARLRRLSGGGEARRLGFEFLPGQYREIARLVPAMFTDTEVGAVAPSVGAELLEGICFDFVDEAPVASRAS
jgi:cellulose synthase/poly-beta-1,6-N-acetylglucosamine synthase-like glycosyltransferase